MVVEYIYIDSVLEDIYNVIYMSGICMVVVYIY